MIRARDALDFRGVYRSVSAVYGALPVTAASAGLVIAAIVPGRGELAGVILAPLFFVIAWRMWLLGVHVEADGVRVVGIVASKRVPWEEIDRFEVRQWQRYPYVGHVVLNSGRAAIPIVAITTTGPRGKEWTRRQAQAPVDRLNEALADWRNGSTSKPKEGK
jgi:hypothetical protein